MNRKLQPQYLRRGFANYSMFIQLGQTDKACFRCSKLGAFVFVILPSDNYTNKKYKI